MKKKVYLVRHGESDTNFNKSHSPPTSPLSKKGFEQAAFIAERCSKLPIELLISSTMTRAMQTAEVIAKKIDLKPEFSDLFVESRGISKFYGLPHSNEEAFETYKLLSKNYGTDWRHSDEETYEDHVARAKAALGFLEQKQETNILVVSHGLFIRILLACIIFDTPTSEEIKKITHRTDLANTSLTIFEYNDETPLNAWGEKIHRWRFWVWNDHAHLG